MASAADILAELRALASQASVQGMAHFGMSVEKRLGVAVPEMRRIAKAAGKDHAAALELWETGIAEARIAASMIAVPAHWISADALRELESEKIQQRLI